jgi:hypothetical protein
MRTPACLLSLSLIAAARTGQCLPGTVTIDGSSTVYPLTRVMVEAFKETADTEIALEVSGTVAGFGRFCRSEIDILNASRPISPAEQDQCYSGGVAFVELPVAFDAMTIGAMNCVSLVLRTPVVDGFPHHVIRSQVAAPEGRCTRPPTSGTSRAWLPAAVTFASTSTATATSSVRQAGDTRPPAV